VSKLRKTAEYALARGMHLPDLGWWRAAPEREVVMRYFVGLVLALALGVAGCSGTAGADGSEFPEAEAAALQALEEYFEAFNARDEEAWAATLNYPHVRFFGSSNVAVWETPEEYMAGFAFDAFEALNPGWDHSEPDSIEIVQSGPDKVHVALQVGRYDAEGNVLETFKTFHVMTNQEGHWGTQARSSYAPL